MTVLLVNGEVSEETVKYLVDHINNDKKNLNSVSATENSVNSIQENLDGLAIVWNTVGGANSIGKADAFAEDMDTSRIKALFQEQMSQEVSYTKVPFLESTVYHQRSKK